MSFKVSSIRFEESRRVVEDELSSNTIERITASATSDPYIPMTQVSADTVSYTITLPNAEPGTKKIFTLISQGETTVTIEYNDPYNVENTDTFTFSRVGDLIIFYATVAGWHRTYYD
jgi:hypothetical protein